MQLLSRIKIPLLTVITAILVLTLVLHSGIATAEESVTQSTQTTQTSDGSTSSSNAVTASDDTTDTTGTTETTDSSDMVTQESTEITDSSDSDSDDEVEEITHSDDTAGGDREDEENNGNEEENNSYTGGSTGYGGHVPDSTPQTGIEDWDPKYVFCVAMLLAGIGMLMYAKRVKLARLDKKQDYPYDDELD